MCVRLNVGRIVFEIIKIFCYRCKLSTAFFATFQNLCQCEFVLQTRLSGLWQGKDATAVVLAINVPFFAKLNGAQIAVAFFEVGCEIRDIVF